MRPWTPYSEPSAGNDRRQSLPVYCLSHAGGTAGVFAPWRSFAVGTGVDICPIELPGHGTRRKEPPIRDIRTLVNALLEGPLAPEGAETYALFGHSVGAAVAYELALQARNTGRPPIALMVSGARPPGCEPAVEMAGLNDADLIAALADLDGTPEPIIEMRELMDLMLPIIRADLAVVANYEPTDTLSIPIRAYCGQSDSIASELWMQKWAEWTSGHFSLCSFPGGHFYLHDDPAAVVRDIVEVLRAYR